jgi:transcriptional regulator with XRE-family HTH domain
VAKSNRTNDLGKKIKGLRECLYPDTPLTQEAFGKRLGVTRSQVSAWESGKESPSNEKLVALGNMAPPIHRIWFYEQAGVDTESLRDDIRRSLVTRRGEPALKEVARIPKLDAAALSKRINGAGEIGNLEATDLVPFPALFIAEPASTICIQATDRVAGAPLRAGDIALVRLLLDNRDSQTREELPFQGLALLLDRLVAVFYENLPNQRELSPGAMRHSRRERPSEDRDGMRAEQRKEDGELARKRSPEGRVPGVLFGTLRVQSDESWNGDFNYLSGGHPWRLLLDCGSTWNGLTDWSTEKFLFDKTLTSRLGSGIHVLGGVIGWLRAPGEARDE